MQVTADDRRVASALAHRIRNASGGPRTWSRLEQLGDSFGIKELTPETSARMETALRRAGIHVSPSLGQLAPPDMVELSMPDTDEHWAAVLGATTEAPGIRATTWGVAGASADVDVIEGQTDDKTAWLDVDPERADRDEIVGNLWLFSNGLVTRRMVEDLVSEQRRPPVRRAYGTKGDIRWVTAVAVDAQTRDSHVDQEKSKAGSMVFRPVNMLIGPSWLITCWHHGQEHPTPFPSGRPVSGYDDVLRAVHRRWSSRGMPSAGDLAMSILLELSGTFPAAERHLRDWFEAWESEFHRRIDGPAVSLADLERRTLVDIRAILTEFRARVDALEHLGGPGAAFAGVSDVDTARRVSQLIDNCQKDLRELGEALSVSIQLLATTSAAGHLAAAERSGRQQERLNRLVALITSVLIVPGFVAQIAGLKSYPGGHSRQEFAVLIIAMVILGAATYSFLIHKGRSTIKPNEERDGRPNIR